jgi:type IV secretion system protein VirB9
MQGRWKILLVSSLIIIASGCSSHGKKPPQITLDEPPVLTVPLPIVPVPELNIATDEEAADATAAHSSNQMITRMPLDAEPVQKAESPDARERVVQANRDALMEPSLFGFINAIQIWPFTEGALYQVYTSPGRVTVISLQAGETLVAVSAGDTARWIVGDTTSGNGDNKQVQILVKPTRENLKTNLVITTDRRIYLLDLVATAKTWMASVSWDYPKDRLAALAKQRAQSEPAAPIKSDVDLQQLRFRYAISGDTPPWRPLRAFDDGQRVFIQFPDGIAQGELPPVFVVGAGGDAELVNYRFRWPYYVIDRLFGAAELRLGGDTAQVVRVTRTDGHRSARP